jgi:hypothetical protein
MDVLDAWKPGSLPCCGPRHRGGYPADKQEKATQTVLEHAEVLSEAWAAA